MSTLNTQSTVAQWVAENPQTAAVFEDLQIDYCCGGDIALAAACRQKQIDPDVVVAQLTRIVANPRGQATEVWLDAELTKLCDHIEQTHHAYLRTELPRLSNLLEKVVNAHQANHPEVRELQRVFAELRAELEPHMFKEEQILFPAIRQMESASNRPRFPFGTVDNPIHMMEHEHATAGQALLLLRDLSHGFQPPDDACNTYRVLLDSLHRLENDLHQHIHKENYILFPRARELESRLDTADAS